MISFFISRLTVHVCFRLFHSLRLYKQKKNHYFSVQFFPCYLPKSPHCINYALILFFFSLILYEKINDSSNLIHIVFVFCCCYFRFPLSNNIDSNIYNLKSRTHKRLLFICPFPMIRPYLLLLALLLYVFFSFSFCPFLFHW